MRHAEITVRGLVEGVGFRYYVRALAVRLHLTGHVKNLDDGTVEIACEGGRGEIDALLERIRSMRPPVMVEDVSVEYSEARGFTKFEMILGDQLQEMAEGFGTGAAYMAMLLEKQDQMLGKQDQMLGKQDQTISEIRALPQSLAEMIDSRFAKLEKEVSEIKARLPN